MLNLDYDCHTEDMTEEKRKGEAYFESLGKDLVFINIRKCKDKQGQDEFETKVNGEYLNESGMFSTLKEAKKACFKDIKERLKICSDDLKRVSK